MAYPYTVAQCQAKIDAYSARIDAHLAGTDAKAIQAGDTRVDGASVKGLEDGVSLWSHRLQ